ncbi:unnamed protein product [Phytophthora fragariaefolia]|uniref:Unnamed protein product n=1 Tax=Phytophthora fragariaefolia TaxID=1490495 RepID=A0A9W6XTN9_9STRA|nr:unnamed protein product [Phytophthora fragariaefolia]
MDSHQERDEIPDPTDTLDPGPDDSTADEQVCYHESGNLHAEDVVAEMAVLPEVTSTTEEVTIDDIQVGDPDINTPEEIERLRRRVWRRRGSSKDGSKLDGSGSDEVSADKNQDESLDLIKPSVLGRRSYTDDILVTAGSWDHLCDRVEDLLDACDRWNLSISVVKRFWGKSKVEYLGHQVSSSGLEANPKDLAALTDLPFPQSLRSMQSFLGSLNYYSRFIENYAIYAAVLYELREVDFAAMSKAENQTQIQDRVARSTPDPDDPAPEQVDPRFNNLDPSPNGSIGVDPRWIRAHRAFDILKERIADTPILRHFDPDKLPVIVVYASTWAISAALMQEHTGVYHPVMFTSRTLKSNVLNYGVVEKEVLAIQRILDLGYNMLLGRQLQVQTRHSTLAWLFRSTGLQGRLGQWAALLSLWTLEIVKCKKGGGEILGVIAAGITPRTEVELALVAIAPKNEPRRQIQTLMPTVLPDERLYVASFDGSARVKRGGGAYSVILWELPEWTVVKARSGYAEGSTVNEAEYYGLLLCLELLEEEDRRRLMICGDSNLVIRQVRGELDCKAPGLILQRQKALDRLRIWPDHDLTHVKRDWNGSAGRLASAALQRQAGIMEEDEADLLDLVTRNRLDGILRPEIIQGGSGARVVPVTIGSRAGSRLGGSGSSGSRPGGPGSDGSRSAPEVHGEAIVRDLRICRIRQAQDEEAWSSGLKTYLADRTQKLTQDEDEAKSYSKISMDYDVDLNKPLYYCPPTKHIDSDRDRLMKLVVPETLQQEVLHYYHVSLEGGHQGIGRTYLQIWSHFQWRGLYRSVQRYVGECVDCETGKGRPTIQGKLPDNIQATYPFQVIAMDHIPSLTKSFKGNTELLIWVDLFSGYVIAKASGSRTAQTIAESYEECVFRRFGASEVIQHDREPGFMADFFRSFNRILGQRQRATMAYRPQGNGTAERMVPTATRALKMYIQDLDQQYWDGYAERLTFAINTAQDRIRGETPSYLVNGWDPRSTLEATILVGSTRRQDRNPRRWSGLYLDRVKEGYARKLAHMWHGPFRVAEKVGEFAVRIEVAGTEYRLFPVMHVSKLKLVKNFPDRPQIQLNPDVTRRLDFDESLLPEDSWIRDLGEDEFEVEKITDMRTGRRTRYGRVYREFLVHWRWCEDPSWVDEADLNGGAVLHEVL